MDKVRFSKSMLAMIGLQDNEAIFEGSAFTFEGGELIFNRSVGQYNINVYGSSLNDMSDIINDIRTINENTPVEALPVKGYHLSIHEFTGRGGRGTIMVSYMRDSVFEAMVSASRRLNREMGLE